jgi:hypothetical protein
MNNQEILKLKIAPVFVSVKIFKGETGYNPTTKHYRSLADIKRITDLERSLKIAECMIENQKLALTNLNAAINVGINNG